MARATEPARGGRGRLLGLALTMAGTWAVGGAAVAAEARFHGEPASPTVRRMADWVVQSADNGPLPFLIVDKVAARVFVFDAGGELRGAAPVLLGLARGDASVPGIGERKLATIRPDERTTPAGRFLAGLGRDLGEKDVVWVDYDAAISLHRVITSNKKERRLERLATPSAADNRISYGCINVPTAFYETVVRPAFLASSGFVYVLPEVRAVWDVFPNFPKDAGPSGAP